MWYHNVYAFSGEKDGTLFIDLVVKKVYDVDEYAVKKDPQCY